MSKDHVERFLSHLATDRRVATTTRKQALNAIVFLYKRFPDIDLGDGIDSARAKRRKNLPVVLTKEQVASALNHMSYRHPLMAKLLDGCRLRVPECILLRIKDVDFEQGRIYVRDSRGGKDRAVVLSESMESDL